jgi:hypothetical protein
MKKFLLTLSPFHSCLVVSVKNTFAVYSLEIPANFPSSAMVLIMSTASIMLLAKCPKVQVISLNIMNKFYILFAGLFLNSLLSNAQWGESDSRIDTHNDAGLQGDASAKSGFFQTQSPVNFPVGAKGRGSTYSYPSGIFHALTDNSNGTLNYYYDGVTNGIRNFGVRADGQGYFAGNVRVKTTTPNGDFDVNGALVVGGNSANLDGANPDKNLGFLENAVRMIIGWNKSKGAGETEFIVNQSGGNVEVKVETAN